MDYYIFIIVDGRFSVGKSEFILMCSEIHIISSGMTSDSHINLYLGRKTLHDENIYLYFFSSPHGTTLPAVKTDLFEKYPESQHRWGSIILVNPSTLLKPKEHNGYFPPINENLSIIETTQEHQIPFVVAMNERKDSPTMPAEMLHAILELDPSIPVLTCNAKDDQRSCELVLLQCLEQLPQDKITQKAIKALKKAIS